MLPEEILQNHVDLCDKVYQLMLEENNILKRTNQHPDEAFIERKRSLLPMLDASLENLKSVRTNPAIDNELNQERIQSAQKKLMKIFYLTRENEQLLLKTTVNLKMSSAQSTPVLSSSKLNQVYRLNK